MPLFFCLLLIILGVLPIIGQSSIDDNFNGSSINTNLWDVVIVPRNVGTITETNQRLQMLKTSSGTGYLGLQGRCKVSGDFDVQVDFALLNWPSQNFHTIRFAAMDLQQGPVGHTGIYRNSYISENYQMRSTGGVVGEVAVSDVSGKLRLKRTASSIEGYYWNGTRFLLITSSSTDTVATRFLIDFTSGTDTAPANVAIAFDNFQVSSGTVVCQNVDAVSDFSIASNPNGVWSYGYTPSRGGRFTLFTDKSTVFPRLNCAGFNSWYAANLPALLPSVIKNITGGSQPCTAGILQAADVLNLHPGSRGENSVVRWTAASSGQIIIQGKFTPVDTQATTDVAILLNSSTLLFSGDINGAGKTLPFSLTQTVKIGDTVDFSVGFGKNGNFLFDSTGLAAQILSPPLVLSQTGLTFKTVIGGGTVPSRTFSVLSGSGIASWRVSTSTLSGGQNWLTATPISGASDAARPAPVVQVQVNPAGLAVGDYYGLIEVVPVDAPNSPQLVAVVFNVLAATVNPGPLAEPTGLIFVGAPAAPNPASQTVQISNLTSQPFTFTARATVVAPKPFLSELPVSGTVAPGEPVQLTVKADLTGPRRGCLLWVRNIDVLRRIDANHQCGSSGRGRRLKLSEKLPRRGGLHAYQARAGVYTLRHKF